MTAEQVVRDFLDALAEADAERAVDLIDQEIEWRNSGLPTLRGKRRVAGVLREMVKRDVGFAVRMHACAAEGSTVLTDRTDVLRYGRWSSEFEVRGTFEVVDGLIRVWDDKFGWGDFTRGSLLGLRGLLRR